MFGAILAIVALGSLGAIALSSAARTTGSKIQQGDTVSVPISQVTLVQPDNVNDKADLQRFLTGFLSPSASVVNIIPAGDFAIGSIVGLAPPIKFPVASVLSITRNGQTFT
jgi:hypothetical protein